MKDWIIGILIVMLWGVIAGWYSETLAQTITITTDDVSTTYTCYEIVEGEVFCE